MSKSFLYRYPEKVNKLDYSKNTIINDTFYGLPKEVKFCKSCVISNQRPVTSVEFRNDGTDKKKVISF